MTHPGANRLQRYVMGELNGERRLAVDEHLLSCGRCQEIVRQEQWLDELVVTSLPPLAPDARERALSKLWQRLDGELAEQSPADAPRARTGTADAPRAPTLVTRGRLGGLLVAATVLAVVVFRQEPPDAATPDKLDSPPAPTVATTDDVIDRDRLADARRQVGEILMSTDARVPFLHQAFRLECEMGLADLRRQGWPVGALARGLALSRDDVAAGAALRYATLDPASLGVLAQALGTTHRVDDALALLSEVSVDIGSSASLVRALERRAAPQELQAQRRQLSLSVLARGNGPWVDDALERLAQRRFSVAARSSTSATDAEALVAEAIASLPAAEALAALREGADQPRLEALCARLFVLRAQDAPEAAAELLDDTLSRSGSADRLLAWCRSAGLEEIVPVLLRQLESGGSQRALLAPLIELGGVQTASGVFELWHASSLPREEQAYEQALLQLLEGDSALTARLGEQLAAPRSESVIRLAERLSSEARGTLLIACLGSPGRDDRGGHRAGLITALARLGDEQTGTDLLGWVEGLGGDDPLRALAWAAAGQLAGPQASAAWQQAGRDPRVLQRAVVASSDRFAAALQPSRRPLAPLRRALELAPAPTHSPQSTMETMP